MFNSHFHSFSFIGAIQAINNFTILTVQQQQIGSLSAAKKQLVDLAHDSPELSKIINGGSCGIPEGQRRNPPPHPLHRKSGLG